MEKMTIVQNSNFGFYEVQPKPSEEELNDYYANKYYQKEESTKVNKYKKSYSQEEIRYIRNKIQQKYQIIKSEIGDTQPLKMLDIGCGEGHALKFFNDRNWEVMGIDYSSFALEHFYPELKECFRQGRNLEELKRLKKEGRLFNLLWMDNVLEHVINPEELLALCHELVTDDGLLMIEVPNDYSIYQQFLFEEGKIPRRHWVAPPDHLSYFSPDSLKKLSTYVGWKTVFLMTDYPIELFLSNEHSNYIKNGTVGKQAHLSRIAIENFLQENNSPEKVNDFYRIMLEVGLGRQLIGVFKR
jgi:2-polyprenyl-3-methyl-5-hydroxy-6-metoxy-1,4-benzoquinol methylase